MMDHYGAPQNDDAWQQAVLAIYDGIVLAEHILSNGDSSAEVSFTLLDEAAAKFGVSA